MFSEKYDELKDWLLEVDHGKNGIKDDFRGGSEEGEADKLGGIAHLNSERAFTYVDSGFLEFLNYDSPEKLMGKNWRKVYKD